MVASAIDQNKVQFDLPLAVGDRVRLFARTMARLQEGGGLNGYSVIGNNGSVLEVERITAEGLQMKTDRGTSGFVKWGALADEKTGRVRLTYGDVISIDAVQSATSTEHINALVSGSQAANGFKGYVAQSRAREISWLVVPDGLERVEIQTKRAMGSTSPVTTGDVWANVGDNLSRQPEKELGVKLLEEATRIYRGSLRDLATAFQPAQQARAEGRQAANGFQERRDERQVAAAAPVLAQGATATAATTARTAKKLVEPDMRQAVRDAKRAAAKSKTRRESVVPVQPVSEADARRQFRDALSDAGLVIKGDPMMDGKPHYTSIRDTKGKRGFYIGHLDGSGVPAGTIINHKTGLRVNWRANVEIRPMTAAESAAYRDKVQAEKEVRDVGQRRNGGGSGTEGAGDMAPGRAAPGGRGTSRRASLSAAQRHIQPRPTGEQARPTYCSHAGRRGNDLGRADHHGRWNEALHGRRPQEGDARGSRKPDRHRANRHRRRSRDRRHTEAGDRLRDRGSL